MLAHEETRGSGVVEVDVREEQMPDVLQLEAPFAQALPQHADAGRRPAVEQRRSLRRLQEVDADHPLAAEVEEVERRRRHAAAVQVCARVASAEIASATSRSARRSSADSRPTDSRTRFPGAANGESTVEACVIRAGTSMRLSTPPRLSAS